MDINKEDSANKWKKKAVDRAKEIKKLKKRLNEVIDSRDSWKNKSDKFMALIKKKQKKKLKIINQKDIGMKQK